MHWTRCCGRGGLHTWIEEKPPCRMSSSTESRYEAKGLPKFECHDADVWQRWCVEDAATGARRYEVPASGGDHVRPLLVAFADECGAQISLLQGLIYGASARMWFSTSLFIEYGMILSWRCRKRACGRMCTSGCIAKIYRPDRSSLQLGGGKRRR